MSTSLKDQLIKAGLVIKKQPQQQRKAKVRGKQAVVQKSQAQQQRDAELAALDALKRDKDKAINAQREQQRLAREQADWVRQLLQAHAVTKQAPGSEDAAFHFGLAEKVHHIYVAAAQRRELTTGALAIAWFDGVYHLLPSTVAAQLAEKVPKRIWLNTPTDQPVPDADDPYAAYQVPDDLTW